MDKSARIVGMVVFVLGIIVLIFVFATAFSMFTSPAEQILAPGAGPDEPVTGPGLGGAVVLVFVRILLLFVMTLAGSLIAARGIQLFLGGGNLRRAEPMPDNRER